MTLNMLHTTVYHVLCSLKTYYLPFYYYFLFPFYIKLHKKKSFLASRVFIVRGDDSRCKSERDAIAAVCPPTGITAARSEDRDRFEKEAETVGAEEAKTLEIKDVKKKGLQELHFDTFFFLNQTISALTHETGITGTHHWTELIADTETSLRDQ